MENVISSEGWLTISLDQTHLNPFSFHHNTGWQPQSIEDSDACCMFLQQVTMASYSQAIKKEEICLDSLTKRVRRDSNRITAAS
jgi:hypothetical protein